MVCAHHCQFQLNYIAKGLKIHLFWLFANQDVIFYLLWTVCNEMAVIVSLGGMLLKWSQLDMNSDWSRFKHYNQPELSIIIKFILRIH